MGKTATPAAPTSINPYEVLSLPTTATEKEIKRAYRKIALRVHPDKVEPSEREAAHSGFQELAFAYAILSDERRRKRYDATGRTSESLDDDSDFDWGSFFDAQFKELVTEEKIEEFRKEYQHSEEEKGDVIHAFVEGKGSIRKLFEVVIFSDRLHDEERFTTMIDAAIESGEISTYPAYQKYKKESPQQRARRTKKAEAVASREAAEADEHAKFLGLNQPNARKKKSGETDDMAGLAAMIQQRQKARGGTFLADLEAKYGGSTKGTHPDEDAFRKMGERATRAKPDAKTPIEGTDDELHQEQQEEPPPKKRRLRKGKA